MLGIAAVIGCAITLLVVPARLSWPRRVRWCVAMQSVAAADPSFGETRLDLREVRVARVDPFGQRLVVAIRSVGQPARELSWLAGPAPSPEDIALLRDWCALNTPMLLHETGDGVVELVGPVPTTFGSLRPLTWVV